MHTTVLSVSHLLLEECTSLGRTEKRVRYHPTATSRRSYHPTLQFVGDGTLMQHLPCLLKQPISARPWLSTLVMRSERTWRIPGSDSALWSENEKLPSLGFFCGSSYPELDKLDSHRESCWRRNTTVTKLGGIEVKAPSLRHLIHRETHTTTLGYLYTNPILLTGELGTHKHEWFVLLLQTSL